MTDMSESEFRDYLIEQRAVFRCAAQWIGKIIADDAHRAAVMPRHCERTLIEVYAAIDRCNELLSPITAIARPQEGAETDTPFQARVQPWMQECFGSEIAADRTERNHRFLEESLELVQAHGCTEDEAHQLVEYVYRRPVGEAFQEVGGVMVTLAALCLAHDLDMHEAAEAELARIWKLIPQIRAKQAGKPRNSPLPQHVGDEQGHYVLSDEFRTALEAAMRQPGHPTPEEQSLIGLSSIAKEIMKSQGGDQ